MLLRIIASVSIVFLLMIDTYAAMNGTVIAVQTTDAWAGGNLTLISIPSLQKKTLLAEPVGGPCLSPDRSKVGFIKDGKIQYVNSDGSSTAPVNTGIAVDVSMPAGADRTDVFGVALYWLNLNGAAGTGEYFYWLTKNGNGWRRAKVGTTTIEQMAAGQYFWGGVSQDGIYASGTDLSWKVSRMNLVLKTATSVTGGNGGCNSSVSPDGKYIMHNLNQGAWDLNYSHTHCIVLDWTTGNQVDSLIESDCTFDNQRWSHFDTAVVMWRNFNQYNACPSQYQSNYGVVYNIKTKERINIGQYMGYDYYPGPVGVIETSASEPVFNPPSGVLAGGMGTVTLTSATAGAAIRYTLDGSVPSSTTGTVLPATGKIDLAVAQGQTTPVKAIAYKSGVAASVVTSAQYRAPDSIAPFTFITPVAGSVYGIGESLPIKWSHRPGMNPSAINLEISLNNGFTYVGMLSGSMPSNDVLWENCPWVIPDVLDNVSLISNQVKIRVSVYGNETVSATSGVFAIAAIAPKQLKMVGRPVVSVTSPTGAGNYNIEVIRDNLYPQSTELDSYYDTYNGSTHTTDYFGYSFDSTMVFTSLKYTYGYINAQHSGLFETMTIEKLVGTTWSAVSGVTVSPAYTTSALSFSAFTFTLPNVEAKGIRVIGKPFVNNWENCAELDVYGVYKNRSTPATAIAPALSNVLAGQRISVKNAGESIQFSLAGNKKSRIDIYSMNGVLIQSVMTVPSANGNNIGNWNRQSRSGVTVRAGIYCAVEAENKKTPRTVRFTIAQ